MCVFFRFLLLFCVVFFYSSSFAQSTFKHSLVQMKQNCKQLRSLNLKQKTVSTSFLSKLFGSSSNDKFLLPEVVFEKDLSKNDLSTSNKLNTLNIQDDNGQKLYFISKLGTSTLKAIMYNVPAYLSEVAKIDSDREEILYHAIDLYLRYCTTKFSSDAIYSRYLQSKKIYQSMKQQFELGKVNNPDLLTSLDQMNNQDFQYKELLANQNTLAQNISDQFGIVANENLSLPDVDFEDSQLNDLDFLQALAIKNNTFLKSENKKLSYYRALLTAHCIPIDIDFSYVHNLLGKAITNPSERFTHKDSNTSNFCLRFNLGFKNFIDFAECKTNMKLQAVTIQMLKEKILSNVNTNFRNFIIEKSKVNHHKKSCQTKKLIVTMQEQNYSLGTVDILKVLDSKFNFYQEQYNLVQAQYSLFISYFNLLKSTGNLNFDCLLQDFFSYKQEKCSKKVIRKNILNSGSKLNCQ